MKKFWREQKNWDNLSQFRGNAILALDRGNDDENTIGFLQSNGYFAVVRQRHERDIFGNAKTIAQNLREGVPAKTILIKNGKNIRGSVRFKLGQMALTGPILAHYFVKDFRSRPSRELSKITKLIKDNFSQINSKTFSFLQNLRALFCEKSLKFISVRPKKPPKIAPKQLIFPFYPA